ncbi:MAG TPA: molybdopterin cofactor-binding domain-containing protein, partial [Isosphaeraceae bacterium]
MPDSLATNGRTGPIPGDAVPAAAGPRPAAGAGIPHESARAHVSGEAVYLDDIPPARGELLVDFVGSPVARGKILRIDLDAARGVEGIVAVLTADDIPGVKAFGPIVEDEDVLARTECRHVGQPVVLLASASREALRRAKAAIRIDVEPIAPVLSIDRAIAEDRFHGPTRTIARGDAALALANAEHVLEGKLRTGGQEHFYLEPQAARAVPGEDGQILVQSSTQNPSEVQSVVAKVLGLPYNKVVCECRRMGGAFGGKETQA